LALQLPYSFLGIGRSNNYVETFFAATSYQGELTQRMWTPIIPNSQMIVFANGGETSDWGLELFMSPTKMLYLIVACCCVLCVIIGIAIIVLHC
jgi:integrin alpha FG-GAP repeat containing protein 1